MPKEIISENPRIEIWQGDCLELMKNIPENSIDCVVTDPPAGIGFMGKEWDNFGIGLSARDKFVGWLEIVAKECLRVMKPGAHALVWALPRTSHWTATSWENVGFEVRDRIIHCFGSGFPKSLNIGKAVDKLNGVKPIGRKEPTGGITGGKNDWKGWGTALKPAVEDWWLLRKPLEKGLNVAENVLKWGTGGLNIDACRIGTEKHKVNVNGFTNIHSNKYDSEIKTLGYREVQGRFPSHLIIDGSEEVKSLFPITKIAGNKKPSDMTGGSSIFGIGQIIKNPKIPNDKGGSASRFFYCAKASREERDMGLDEFPLKQKAHLSRESRVSECIHASKGMERWETICRNNHPTVKPVKLMEYLVKLVCPPNGIVLDPFMGSGSTGIACANLNKNFIGIEINQEYYEIAKARIKSVSAQMKLNNFM